jgi:hypothetical protein
MTRRNKKMYAEIMQISIAVCMMVQTGLTLRNAMRTEQSQAAGAPKIAPELKIESAHSKESASAPESAGAPRETPAVELSAGDANPVA